MSSKHAAKRPRSNRYLLFANRQLHKLSLRRLVARARNAAKAAHPSRGRAAREKNSGRILWTTRTHARTIAVSAVGVMVVVVLIAARGSSNSADLPNTDALKSMSGAAIGARPDSRNASKGEPGKIRPSQPAAAALVPESTTADASPASGAQAPASVTVTGCLERDHDAFRLKDTDAPKARSWKTGFLKKHASTLELVDAENAVKLPSHLGQRVAATGVVTNGEMRVRSLQRVAASCTAT